MNLNFSEDESDSSSEEIEEDGNGWDYYDEEGDSSSEETSKPEIESSSYHNAGNIKKTRKSSIASSNFDRNSNYPNFKAISENSNLDDLHIKNWDRNSNLPSTILSKWFCSSQD
jgi:patatin-like phospholipase/acyl hydrolase